MKMRALVSTVLALHLVKLIWHSPHMNTNTRGLGNTEKGGLLNSTQVLRSISKCEGKMFIE